MAKTQQAAQGKGFGLLFEMGCGKTLTAIAIAEIGRASCRERVY